MPALSDLLTADQATLRQTLLNQIATDAYKEGDFTLSSGQKSTYYINGKLVTLTPMGALLIGRLILAQLDQDVAAVAGLTLGLTRLLAPSVLCQPTKIVPFRL